MMDPSELYGRLRDVLSANWRLQDRLGEVMKDTENSLLNGVDMQANLRILKLAENRTGSYAGQRCVDLPSVGKVRGHNVEPSSFWRAAGKVPAPNGDTVALQDAYAYLPHTYAHVIKQWTPQEDSDLQKAIACRLQEADRTDEMQEHLQEFPLADSEPTLDSGSLRKVNAFTSRDWAVVEHQLACNWTANECCARWHGHTKLKLRRASQALADHEESWTPQEVAKLQKLASKYRSRQWPSIATELQTGKTPAECLTWYQTHATNTTKAWTQAEIQQLRISYIAHAGKAAFWKAVSSDLPGRTPDQVMHFWRNKMDINIRKGRWSADEDEALRQAVMAFGTKWARVAEAVSTRNQVQVRERWVNKLDPQLRSGEAWTEEEDRLLDVALRECRNPDGSARWADIARRLPGRTDDAVSNHVLTMRRQAERQKSERAAKKTNFQASAGAKQPPAKLQAHQSCIDGHGAADAEFEQAESRADIPAKTVLQATQHRGKASKAVILDKRPAGRAKRLAGGSLASSVSKKKRKTGKSSEQL